MQGNLRQEQQFELHDLVRLKGFESRMLVTGIVGSKWLSCEDVRAMIRKGDFKSSHFNGSYPQYVPCTPAWFFRAQVSFNVGKYFDIFRKCRLEPSNLMLQENLVALSTTTYGSMFVGYCWDQTLRE